MLQWIHESHRSNTCNTRRRYSDPWGKWIAILGNMVRIFFPILLEIPSPISMNYSMVPVCPSHISDLSSHAKGSPRGPCGTHSNGCIAIIQKQLEHHKDFCLDKLDSKNQGYNWYNLFRSIFRSGRFLEIKPNSSPLKKKTNSLLHSCLWEFTRFPSFVHIKIVRNMNPIHIH